MLGVVSHKKSYKSGDKVGRLTIIDMHHKNHYGRYYTCRCECGNLSIVRGSNLSQFHSTSCGCQGRKGYSYRVIPQDVVDRDIQLKPIFEGIVRKYQAKFV